MEKHSWVDAEQSTELVMKISSVLSADGYPADSIFSTTVLPNEKEKNYHFISVNLYGTSDMCQPSVVDPRKLG